MKMVKIYCIKTLLLTTYLFGCFLLLSKNSYAASDIPLFSLNNTNFVVSLAFLAFVGILVYLKVPVKIAGLLDNRAKLIGDEINTANSLLEEAKKMLAKLEREHKTNIEKAAKIVSDAELEAKQMLNEAKKEVRLTIERKIKLAEDQISATEASVIKSIKNMAVDKSIETAESELLKLTNAKMSASLLEEAIKDVDMSFKNFRS
jgi:F-type H+-transporting ATPase subunit b